MHTSFFFLLRLNSQNSLLHQRSRSIFSDLHLINFYICNMLSKFTFLPCTVKRKSSIFSLLKRIFHGKIFLEMSKQWSRAVAPLRMKLFSLFLNWSKRHSSTYDDQAMYANRHFRIHNAIYKTLRPVYRDNDQSSDK